MSAPFLSVVIPVFDRETVLERCLASALGQSCDAPYEVVAIDDGSTDGSRSLLAGHAEPHLVVLSHARNRGVCPARNTGIAASRGEWIVFLDSDDEFADAGSLARIASLARAAPSEIGALWFRSRLDDGRLAPEAMPSVRDWDYDAYLRFLEATIGQPRDMIRCVRRSCFAALRYPESRMLEEAFHLDFARRFRSRLHPDVLRLYHQDAGNQITRTLGREPSGLRRRTARDRARGLRTLLEAHGAALARIAPRTHADLVRRARNQALLACLPSPLAASAQRLDRWRRGTPPGLAIETA